MVHRYGAVFVPLKEYCYFSAYFLCGQCFRLFIYELSHYIYRHILEQFAQPLDGGLRRFLAAKGGETEKTFATRAKSCAGCPDYLRVL